tara:strand:+ start:25 stop:453 length:429 start_codon:yes stop_codon:yes gene_type:complete
MKNNIEKVYGKLPKKKLGLKKHKVALSLVDDIDKLTSEIQTDIDLSATIIDKIDTQMVAVDVAMNEMRTVIEDAEIERTNIEGQLGEIDFLKTKVEEAANLLGINPSDIDLYDMMIRQRDEIVDAAGGILNFINMAKRDFNL